MQYLKISMMRGQFTLTPFPILASFWVDFFSEIDMFYRFLEDKSVVKR